MKGLVVTSDKRKYPSITVSDEDDDDVVIRAGARSTHGGRVAVPDETEDVTVEDDVGPRVVEAERREGESAEEESGGSDESGRDRYRETTEEDIRSSSMPTMQKVIIVVALCLIVGFAIYYNFLR